MKVTNDRRRHIRTRLLQAEEGRLTMTDDKRERITLYSVEADFGGHTKIAPGPHERRREAEIRAENLNDEAPYLNARVIETTWVMETP